MTQCKAKNRAMRPPTYCLKDVGHDEPHEDYYYNTWRHGDDEPHFTRVDRTVRFFVEVDVTGRDADEIATIRDECEGAILLVLDRYGIDPMVERRKVRDSFVIERDAIEEETS